MNISQNIACIFYKEKLLLCEISLMFNKIQKKIGKPNPRQSNLSMSKADITVNQKQWSYLDPFFLLCGQNILLLYQVGPAPHSLLKEK